MAEKNEMIWSAPEFHYVEKTSIWYLGVVVIGALLALVGLWQGNTLFIIFVVLAAVVAFFTGQRPAKQREYTLTDEGIMIDGVMRHAYVELDGFAVVDDQFGTEYSEVVLRPKKQISTYLKILVLDSRAGEAKEFLAERVPVMEYNNSLADSLLRQTGL